MRGKRLILLLLASLLALPLAAQFRDDQFKRDAFSQSYTDSSSKTEADSSSLFNIKEFFGGLAGKQSASLKTLTIGSAVMVGGNQIYNRQYWKLPIVYGGIGAGITGGILFNKKFQETGDTKYRTFRTLSYMGAGLAYWGSLMDGVIMFDRGGKYPNPSKATFYSLLCPGLGQIYNGELWKVPLYWGLLAGSVHFCVDNNVQYQRWKWIYDQATIEDESIERPPWSAENAKYYRDIYRRYRDYSILAIALVYVVQIVDANVFSFMQDFEVNDDISMRVEPAVVPNQYAAAPAMGMRIGLTF